MLKKRKIKNIDKYMDFAAEVREQFRVKTVIVPITVGALGTVPAKLSKLMEILVKDDVIESL